MTNPKKVMILPNGTVAVFDENGEQIPEFQGGWINFDYLMKLGKLIAENESTLEVEYKARNFISIPRIVMSSIGDYINYHRENPLADTHCGKCFHPIESHQSKRGFAKECVDANDYGSHCGCKEKFITAEAIKEEKDLKKRCAKCKHLKAFHWTVTPHCTPRGGCNCDGFTMAEQSESYLRSDQLAHSSQSPEPQSRDHSQCKFRHDHTAGDPLAHTGSIQELNHPEGLVRDWGPISRTLLVLLKCEEAECRVCRRLVEQALNSLRLALNYSHPTHKEDRQGGS